MWVYILRNLFYSILIIVGVLTVTFCLLYIIPGDPARMMLGQRADVASVEAVREELGLNKPIYIQYVRFMGNAFQGDLGRSYASNREVVKTILEKFPATALLAFSALLISSILGVLIGIISAIKKYTIWDNAAMIFALFGISFPAFAFGLIMALVFGHLLKWFPISGYITDGCSISCFTDAYTCFKTYGNNSEDYSFVNARCIESGLCKNCKSKGIELKIRNIKTYFKKCFESCNYNNQRFTCCHTWRSFFH